MSKKRMAALAAELKSSRRRTPEERIAVMQNALPQDVMWLIEELLPVPSNASNVLVELVDSLRNAAKAGFVIAVARYGKELRASKEAMGIINYRTAALDKGHATQAKRSSELHRRIRDKWAAMEAGGEKVTNDTVAAAVRADGVQCSRSTVIRAFKDKPSTAPAKRAPRRRR